MSDLNNNLHKGSPLLYLREDKLKETLNNFFLVYKTFENQILDNASVNGFGIADIRCILIILLYPGITFNELLIKLRITKQSLNRVLKILLEKKMVIQEINKNHSSSSNNEIEDILKQVDIKNKQMRVMLMKTIVQTESAKILMGNSELSVEEQEIIEKCCGST